ncbi:hypothetical protein [Tunicatimonas pelagia]|uniref:hypothetical protein n=1 Tax=Tunicatimonas pelagia TaxID=931531 RepID=UPI002665D887|nr:hypothetical protein [Tunicatimonas pelagia]WKN44629.1 hypothetical protein P0M28_06585 [Tunicatimonas pelagia]
MSRKSVKPQTKQELAHSYGVTSRTLTNWLTPHQERIGKRQGHTYTPKQVQIIYEILGEPVDSDE